jgi:uncharacterized protein (DUF1800 family)
MQNRKIVRLVCIAFLLPLAGVTAAPPPSPIPARPDDKTIVHVLNRLGFGPAPGDIERVRRMGLEKYINGQLHPDTLGDSRMAEHLAGLDTLAMSSRDLAQAYFVPALMERRRVREQAASQPSEAAAPSREMRTPEQMKLMQGERKVFTDLAQQKILRAVYSERQLEEVMVDFWFNHFNVFAGKGQTRAYLTEYDRETIRPNVFGKFRTLLGATAQSPAMLFYLDNWQSAAAEGVPTSSASQRRRRNLLAGARRPRGIAGTAMPGRVPVAPIRQARGLNENYARELMELHTLGVDGGYTQNDVQEVARAFTGWTIANPRQGGGFRFEPRMHDDGEKIVLGHRIEAGGGKRDAEEVLDILASHPATARFIATKLARRFIADDPPTPIVERAAARFRDTNGDIREVVRTIVTSPEFFAAAAYRAKVKNPFEFVVSALRATSAETADAMPVVQATRELGMPPYQCQPPTGYADRAEAWVNTGALLNRMNFAVSLTSGRLRGIRVAPADAALPAAAGDAIVNGVLAGDLAPSTRATVAKASNEPQALALLLGSPEFQRR